MAYCMTFCTFEREREQERRKRERERERDVVGDRGTDPPTEGAMADPVRDVESSLLVCAGRLAAARPLLCRVCGDRSRPGVRERAGSANGRLRSSSRSLGH